MIFFDRSDLLSQLLAFTAALNVTLCVYTAKLMIYGRRRKQAELFAGDEQDNPIRLW